jgi:hypothetical protein
MENYSEETERGQRCFEGIIKNQETEWITVALSGSVYSDIILWLTISIGTQNLLPNKVF